MSFFCFRNTMQMHLCRSVGCWSLPSAAAGTSDLVCAAAGLLGQSCGVCTWGSLMRLPLAWLMPYEAATAWSMPQHTRCGHAGPTGSCAVLTLTLLQWLTSWTMSEGAVQWRRVLCVQLVCQGSWRGGSGVVGWMFAGDTGFRWSTSACCSCVVWGVCGGTFLHCTCAPCT
jgi:hypothetical protein